MAPDHVLVLIMAGVLFAAWDGFCLWDLARAKEARVLISFPLGGIFYICFGHEWT